MRLNSAIQEALITLLLHDGSVDGGKAVRALIPPRLYDPFFKTLAEAAHNYWEQYKQPPADHTLDLINTIKEREPDSAAIYDRIFTSIEDNKSRINKKYILDQANQFARLQRIKSTTSQTLQVLKRAEAGDKVALDEAEALMQKVGKDSYNIQDCGLLLNDPEQALRFLDVEDQVQTFRTGIKELDQYDLGPTRKKYHLTSAPTGTGKCVSLGARIWSPSHGYRRMEELVKVRATWGQVVGFDEVEGLPRESAVTAVFPSGHKPLCRIKLRSGRILRGLAETHPVLTWNGYVRASELRLGDYVIGTKILPLTGSSTWEQRKQCYAVGVFIGDGCLVVKKGGPRLSIHRSEIGLVDRLSRIIGFSPTSICRRSENGFDVAYPVDTFNLLDQWGVERKKGPQKHVPKSVYERGPEAVAACLAGLFDTDGYVSKRGKIELCSASYRLSEDYLTMLNVLGIYAIRRRKRIRLGSKTFHAWSVGINDEESISIFHARVGIYGQHKNKWKRMANRPIPVRSPGQFFCRLPVFVYQRMVAKLLDGPRRVDKTVAGAWRAAGLSNPRASSDLLRRYVRQGNRVSPKTARVLAEYTEDSFVAVMASGELVFDEVVSIKPDGEAECWDLTVEGTHSFIAEHVFTHNSWAAMQYGRMGLIDGARVVHITCEMTEEEVGQRYVQSLCSVKKRESEMIVRYLRMDSKGRFEGLDEEVLKRPSFKDDNIRSILLKALKPLKRRPSLYIKEFPSGTCTVRAVKAYLDNLEATRNFSPDLCIIDYPDLFDHDPKHKRQELEKITVDLRGLAGERNIAVAGFSQVNEKTSGGKQGVVSTGRAAEGRAKEHTADIVLTLNQTPAEYELGLMRIYVAKARGDVKGFQVLISQALNAGQFCLSSALMNKNRYWSEVGTEEQGVDEGESDD